MWCARCITHDVDCSSVAFYEQDFFERGTLNVKTLKFRVLDEADEMLNMGFVDDVELILGMVAHIGVALIHVLLNISLKCYTPTLRLHFLLIMFMGFVY